MRDQFGVPYAMTADERERHRRLSLACKCNGDDQDAADLEEFEEQMYVKYEIHDRDKGAELP